MGALKLLYHPESKPLKIVSCNFKEGAEKKKPFSKSGVNYYPYGKILREYSNGEVERFLTTQHERDKETGLDYRGARFYDSDVARFLSLDPLAAEYPSLSDYSYVAGNPVLFIDPTGMAVEDHWLIGDDGSVEKISDQGGSDYQLFTFGGDITRNDEGKIIGISNARGTSVIETGNVLGQDFFVGPVARSNGAVDHGVSTVDLWGDVPDEYLGHYGAFSLTQRYSYLQDHQNGISSTAYNNVRAQEMLGLSRSDMIWSMTDDYNYIVGKYGSDATLFMAFEYDMMPLPGGGGSSGLGGAGPRSLNAGLNGLKGMGNGKNIRFNINGMRKSIPSDKNSWRRFLKANKGKYRGRGKNWIQDAVNDYNAQKAKGLW